MTILTNTNAISFMERLQLKTIKNFDNNCQQIVYSANDISVSFYEKLSHEWLKDNVFGPLFLYQTNDDRKYSLIVLNNNILIDMKSYSINEFSAINICVEDQFIKLDKIQGNYSLAMRFKTNDHASSMYTKLTEVSNICKGLESPITHKTLVEKENKIEPVLFCSSYSNKRKLDLYRDIHKTDTRDIKRKQHTNDSDQSSDNNSDFSTDKINENINRKMYNNVNNSNYEVQNTNSYNNKYINNHNYNNYNKINNNDIYYNNNKSTLYHQYNNNYNHTNYNSSNNYNTNKDNNNNNDNKNTYYHQYNNNNNYYNKNYNNYNHHTYKSSINYNKMTYNNIDMYENGRDMHVKESDMNWRRKAPVS